MLKTDVFTFLEKLKNNNNKNWFDKNKNIYKQARIDFTKFIDELTFQITTFDESISKGIDKNVHIFKINRDLRFSKDKTPYKSNFGAIIAPDGNKTKLPGYYIHIEPNKSAIATGIYNPEGEDLVKIREYISKNYKKLDSILNKKKFKSYFDTLNNDNKLKRIPTGFKNDHPAGDYLKLKTFHVWKTIDDNDFTSPDILKKILIYFKEGKKLNDYLTKAVIKY